MNARSRNLRARYQWRRVRRARAEAARLDELDALCYVATSQRRALCERGICAELAAPGRPVCRGCAEDLAAVRA